MQISPKPPFVLNTYFCFILPVLPFQIKLTINYSYVFINVASGEGKAWNKYVNCESINELITVAFP